MHVRVVIVWRRGGISRSRLTAWIHHSTKILEVSTASLGGTQTHRVECAPTRFKILLHKRRHWWRSSWITSHLMEQIRHHFSESWLQKAGNLALGRLSRLCEPLLNVPDRYSFTSKFRIQTALEATGLVDAPHAVGFHVADNNPTEEHVLTGCRIYCRSIHPGKLLQLLISNLNQISTFSLVAILSNSVLIGIRWIS